MSARGEHPTQPQPTPLQPRSYCPLPRDRVLPIYGTLNHPPPARAVCQNTVRRVHVQHAQSASPPECTGRAARVSADPARGCGRLFHFGCPTQHWESRKRASDSGASVSYQGVVCVLYYGFVYVVYLVFLFGLALIETISRSQRQAASFAAHLPSGDASWSAWRPAYADGGGASTWSAEACC